MFLPTSNAVVERQLSRSSSTWVVRWCLSATVLSVTVLPSWVLCSAEGIPVYYGMIIAMCTNFLSLSQVLYKLWSCFHDCTEPLQACKVALKVLLESRDMEALNRYWDHWSGSINDRAWISHKSIAKQARDKPTVKWPFKKLIVIWVYLFNYENLCNLWSCSFQVTLKFFAKPLQLITEWLKWFSKYLKWFSGRRFSGRMKLFIKLLRPFAEFI